MEGEVVGSRLTECVYAFNVLTKEVKKWKIPSLKHVSESESYKKSNVSSSP